MSLEDKVGQLFVGNVYDIARLTHAPTSIASYSWTAPAMQRSRQETTASRAKRR
jgi:hypothetical protein